MTETKTPRARSRIAAWKRDAQREHDSLTAAAKETVAEEGQAALRALPRIAARLAAIVASPALYLLAWKADLLSNPAWALVIFALLLSGIYACTRARRDAAAAILASVAALPLLFAVTSATVGLAALGGLAAVWLASPFVGESLLDALPS